jgi:hypothetical protein
MTPREWCLLEDGAADHIEQEERRRAYWMAWHITATTGKVMQPAQLLGEDNEAHTESSTAAEQRAATRKHKALMRTIARRQKKGN